MALEKLTRVGGKLGIRETYIYIYIHGVGKSRRRRNSRLQKLPVRNSKQLGSPESMKSTDTSGRRLSGLLNLAKFWKPECGSRYLDILVNASQKSLRVVKRET